MLSLLGFFGALFALIGKDDEEHVAGEPESCGHGNGSKGGLHLSDQRIRREGERAEQDGHHAEHAEREDVCDEVMAFA